MARQEIKEVEKLVESMKKRSPSVFTAAQAEREKKKHMLAQQQRMSMGMGGSGSGGGGGLGGERSHFVSSLVRNSHGPGVGASGTHVSTSSSSPLNGNMKGVEEAGESRVMSASARPPPLLPGSASSAISTPPSSSSSSSTAQAASSTSSPSASSSSSGSIKSGTAGATSTAAAGAAPPDANSSGLLVNGVGMAAIAAGSERVCAFPGSCLVLLEDDDVERRRRGEERLCRMHVRHLSICILCIRLELLLVFSTLGSSPVAASHVLEHSLNQAALLQCHSSYAQRTQDATRLTRWLGGRWRLLCRQLNTRRSRQVKIRSRKTT